jgi:NAD+ kinase
LKKLADKIKSVGLIGNSDKPACAESVRKAAQLIQRAGRKVLCDTVTARLAGLKNSACGNAAELARKVDLLLVFGGDGTMLHVAREIAGSPTPMLGVNIGGLGFLTGVPSDEIARALANVWRGEFKYESRALIEVGGRWQGRQTIETALNDIVISRSGVLRLIKLDVCVDDELVARYHGDGLIISSPTGSTAYSLAAGGAIVSPTAEVFALTPICPHTLSNRPLILPLASTIRVKVVGSPSATLLSADGQFVAELVAGDEVTVRRSRGAVRLMHLADSSFWETLRRKLHWRGAYL